MDEVDGQPVDRKGAALDDLLVAAQVDHGAQPERRQHRQIVGGEAVQSVAPQQPPPGDRPSVGDAVAAEIANVVGALERDRAPRVGHERRCRGSAHVPDGIDRTA